MDEANSQLYDVLCNANGSGNCVFRPNIVLDTNLDCLGSECEVDNVNLVIVEDDIKYEYVRPACIELGFSNGQELNKIVNRFKEAMCLNKNIDDVAMHACCVSDNPQHWLSDYAENFCTFSFEKSSYATTQSRCQNKEVTNFANPNTCDWKGIRSYSNNENPNSGYCHFWIDSYIPSWHWTNQTCSMMAKGKEQIF